MSIRQLMSNGQNLSIQLKPKPTMVSMSYLQKFVLVSARQITPGTSDAIQSLLDVPNEPERI